MLANIRAHQSAFQAIATASNGTRHSTSPGFVASLQYVRQAMLSAGYQVTEQVFPIDVAADATPPALAVISPVPFSYQNTVDFRSMSYSGSGDVVRPVTAIDLLLPAPPTSDQSTSGCEPSDFAGFPPGNIALIQRGSCTFAIKVQNAVAAGAAGVIIFNEGSPGRTGVLSGTLSAPQKPVPVVSTSFPVGQQIANVPGIIVRVKVDFQVGTFNSSNLIAESPVGNPGDVVVLGAPLDSDRGGPGINHVSGAAAQLEIARVYAKDRTPRNRTRFIWFGGFYDGLVGSTAYVAALSPADRARIRAMVLLPALGSPNFARFVFDGDNSTFPAGPGIGTGPAGSGEIERIFTDYFAATTLASAPTALSLFADYAPFMAAVIPVGGVFAGQPGFKTAGEVALFGGTAGVLHDPCYTLYCDTFVNTSTTALDELSDAAAHAVWLLARKNFSK